MTFWDFANNNPVTLLLIIFFVVEGIVNVARAICNKKEPYECKEDED